MDQHISFRRKLLYILEVQYQVVRDVFEDHILILGLHLT